MLEFAGFHARLCRTLLTQMLEFAARPSGLTNPLRSFTQEAVVKGWLLTAALPIALLPARAQEPDSQRQALIARAKALELSFATASPHPADCRC